MFPARAGMSRVKRGCVFLPLDVPRVSGDEPVTEKALTARFACSPRERG